MNKKYLLILLALVILLIYSKRSTAAEPKPAPLPDETNQGWASTFVSVVKGDTLYKIAQKFWDPEQAGPPTREKILNFARQQAYANGFNWDKYDDVPSADLDDPDTLKPGQKLVMYTWGSFNENNPKTGAIMPGQQINAFNSWETL
jgi:hypothetical protein